MFNVNTQFDAGFIDERSEQTSTPALGRGLGVGALIAFNVFHQQRVVLPTMKV